MTRILILITSIGVLTACAQYREPNANCFSFRATDTAAKPDCTFLPLSGPSSSNAS